MSKTTLPDYLGAATELQSAGLAVNPAELHGLLTGMLSGGLSLNDDSWQPLLFDYTNDGMGWPSGALLVAKSVLEASKQEMTGTSLEMELLLPDDDAGASLFDLADGVADWVNHFISGLGLVNAGLKNASADVKEALADMEEIARLGIDEDDDLGEQAQLLLQVVEHIKACVLTIHAELGSRPAPESTPTIH
ncbi:MULTISPECIES: YecA/YgfB family protein [Vibrio]|uniref:UPF0149 protein VPR01S_21_00170 n=1 Tax=Vibrio proteolyticus NBRC 13287 TaxID=1219065 RepID=U3A6I1_VIBPR|nr:MULTISPECIES: YecA family protein [Vibrio]NAW60235.1 UPF0149 family protein [Vibrio sp. V36_P2S2PM302]NAX21051.1 UPF0149 family protein [Vibrio sp. V39_P1S14PM300]NAX28202.1 UPF0149 family protein [Vibrio sp. V38_P2S17PM301]NAX32470.1 UPF0149 family protein [Vibrio sp. V37_P2S8PM304]GAD68932.1 hypothetical protein VPR01S_21_00170 [Vibrio proteolyticus NBRC 13287]